MLAWYTKHVISQRIILRSVAPGWNIPAKNTTLFSGSEKDKYADEAILYGILRGCDDVMHYNFKRGIDYLHLDHGYIGRSRQHCFDGYYRVSLNNTQADYKDIDLPSDRAKKLNVSLKDWKDNKDGFILIVPHTEAMQRFYGVDIKKWIDTTIKKIGDLPYKIRFKEDVIPLKEDLNSAKCVITFNSNTALDATLEGIPAIATSQHSIIRDWNKLNMSDVYDCYNKSISLDRNKLLNFISYHQFTLKEMETGYAKNVINEMRRRNVY